MEEITLNFPAELLKALEGAASTEKISLAQWIQNRLIGQVAREAAFKEVFGKPPPTLRMDFVRDNQGRLLEGDKLLMVLQSTYRKMYRESGGTGGDDPKNWH
jgi:hypothetical protein